MPKSLSPELGNSLIAQFILQTLRAQMDMKHPSDVSEKLRKREEATMHITNHAKLASRRCPLLVPTLTSSDLKRSFLSVVLIIFYLTIKLTITFGFNLT